MNNHLHPKIWVPALVAVTVVVGYLLWAKESQEWPFAGGSDQRIANSDKKGKDDTSNWKTYRNEEYGFEVKYPDGWNVIDRDLQVTPQEVGSQIRFYDPLNESDIIIVNVAKNDPIQANETNSKLSVKYKLGGQETYESRQELIEGAEGTLVLWTHKDDYYYVIFPINPDRFRFDNQILSTFKFTHTP